MYIVASFEQTIFLELAISALEQQDIAQDQILAVPLDKRKDERRLFDTIYRADGVSLFDLASVLGTCGMLLGAIYGMIFRWGPILWGIIGLIGGMSLGFLVKYLIIKLNKKPPTRGRGLTEVVLLIRCDSDKGRLVETILWDNQALGVARLKMGG